MAKKTNDLDIHTFQIVPADESSVATPRLDEVEIDKSFGGVEKSTSFKELSKEKISAKNRPKLASKISKSIGGKIKPSSEKLKSSLEVTKNSKDKTTEILQGLVMAVGLALVVIVIDYVTILLK